MTPLIVIPAYNEVDTLPDVLASLPKDWEVLVVDDGSTDGTGDCGADVLSLGENQGYGEAVLAGLREAQKRGYSHAVVMDADGQHRATDVAKVVGFLQDYPDACIVGNRYGEQSQVVGCEAPKERKELNRELSDLIARIIDLEIPDVFCGLLGLPLDQVLGLPLEGRGYGFTLELWVMGGLMGQSFLTVDIDRVYDATRMGDWASLARRRRYYLDVIHQTWSVYSEEYVPLS